MTNYYGSMSFLDGSDPQNALDFMLRQFVGHEVVTGFLAEVKEVDATQRRLSLLPLVQQVSMTGTPIPHGLLHDIPYGYEQAGECLVKIDPQVGDIGIAFCCHRDITRIKATKGAAPPSTARTHDWTDAVYLRTLWTKKTPRHVISLTPEEGLTLSSDVPVKIQADLHVSGTIVAQGDVKGGGISLDNHTHGGVKAGGDSTGGPQ